MRPPRLVSVLSLLLLAPACADETAAPDAAAPATALERLVDSPRLVGLFPDQATISLEVVIRRGDGWQEYRASPSLDHGTITLAARPDGRVQLTAAWLSFDDIMVGDKGIPPTGLHLTGLQVRTRDLHECDWVDWAEDDEACSASIPAVFYLDWSMVVSDGEVVPLGTQELAPMDLRVDVARDERGIAADLQVVEPGTLWSWAGIVEFRNFELAAPGHEVVPL